METLVIAIILAVVVFALLSLAAGTDSRPIDDARPWWPGVRSDDRYTRHHA
jgi:hypothetical protein